MTGAKKGVVFSVQSSAKTAVLCINNAAYL